METTVSSPEAAAVDALKAKLEDSNCPVFARAFGTHLKTYPQEPEQLAEKLGRSRPWGIQMFGISKLDEDILAKAEKDGASFRELRKLYTSPQSGINENYRGNKTGNTGNSDLVTGNSPENSGNNEYNSGNTPGNTISAGFPLIRRTITVMIEGLHFWSWSKDYPEKVGEVADRWLIRLWTGWWIIGLGVLAIGLAADGFWHTRHLQTWATRFELGVTPIGAI
jgi:hypothetical protein